MSGVPAQRESSAGAAVVWPSQARAHTASRAGYVFVSNRAVRFKRRNMSGKALLLANKHNAKASWLICRHCCICHAGVPHESQDKQGSCYVKINVCPAAHRKPIEVQGGKVRPGSFKLPRFVISTLLAQHFTASVLPARSTAAYTSDWREQATPEAQKPQKTGTSRGSAGHSGQHGRPVLAAAHAILPPLRHLRHRRLRAAGYDGEPLQPRQLGSGLQPLPARPRQRPACAPGEPAAQCRAGGACYAGIAAVLRVFCTDKAVHIGRFQAERGCARVQVRRSSYHGARPGSTGPPCAVCSIGNFESLAASSAPVPGLGSAWPLFVAVGGTQPLLWGAWCCWR